MTHVLTFTEAGGHAVNEDCFEVRRHGDHVLVALADGMGGQAGGKRAAEVACRAVVDAAVRVAGVALLDPAAWVTLVRAADGAVRADAEAGFTTLVAFAVGDGVVAGASCGDSALFVTSFGEIEELTAGQEKNPPVGSGGAAGRPFTAAHGPDWAVLAVTDGVWKYMGLSAVRRALAELRGEALIDELKSRARLRSGRFPDDFTVVLVESSVG